MKQNLFSYGTLQQHEVQIELFGRILKGASDILFSYKTEPVVIDGRTYSIAVSSNNKSDFVNGTVLELSDEELLIADKYETEEYKRVKQILQSGKETWVYVSRKL